MLSSTENAKSRELVLRFFLFVLLLLPVVYLVSLVAKCGVNVPYADEFGMAPLLVKAHDHAVTLTDLFRQHNEHRYFFPHLLFIAFAWLGRGDLRLEMFSSVFFVLLVSLNLWLLARKTIPGSVSQSLVLVFLFNLFLFSPVQAENWTWGFQFPLFLCNFLFCCGLLTAASGLHIATKFLVCLVLTLVATFSFGGGVLLWALTFPLALVLHHEMSWKSRIALAVAWGGAALGAIALYFFHYVRPPLHPTIAASRNPIDYFLYVTTFLGAHLSRASRLEPILQAVTVGSGLLVLWGIAVAYTIRYRRDSDLTKRTLPWLALGVYAVLNALLAAAARIGFGVNQALDSRYTSFSLYLGIAVIGLLAIIKQDMRSRDSGRRFAGICVRSETALLTAFAAFSLTAFMWGRTTMIETQRNRLLGKSALLFSNVIPSGEIHDRYLMANAPDARSYANLLDSIGLLHPRMLGSAEILKLKRGKAGDAGYLDYITQSGAVCTVVGWAILPKRGTPAHCVVLSYEDPKRGPVAFQIADETQLRTDVAAVLHNPAAEKSGWICHFDRSQLPTGDLLLSAWAFDANRAILYQLGTPKIVH
jgi:hypothetical protein